MCSKGALLKNVIASKAFSAVWSSEVANESRGQSAGAEIAAVALGSFAMTDRIVF
jgi:hypothetical protein